MKYEVLRKKYPRFVYEKYSWKISNGNLNISFNFRIKPDIFFKPKVIIENVDENKIKRLQPPHHPPADGGPLVGVNSPRVLNNLIFHLGLIEVLSYWKTTCSPEIEILAGPLNKKQIKWWQDLIVNGMGQFFYENRIDFRKPNFLKIKANYIRANSAMTELPRTNRNKILIPVGGGKDSIVTLELLKEVEKNINCFSLNPTEAAQKIMKIAGCAKPIIVRRGIDPKLLELNRRGFLNGHTPFSAYLAFLSTLLATIFDLKFIALSNERSSNEGNLKYLGQMINHQYSKSFDFEKKFRKYSQKYLTSSVNYFSFLRPLYEIQIAKLFSQYPKYFNAFLSCNEAYKTHSGTKLPTKKWCGRCPKCLFVFTALYPFIEESELLKIFRKNLFEDEKLLPIMLELIGEKRFKPFECVGTKKENLVAFYLALRSFTRRRVKLPILLKYFEKKISQKYPNLEKESQRVMTSWSNQYYLPKDFKGISKRPIHF